MRRTHALPWLLALLSLALWLGAAACDSDSNGHGDGGDDPDGTTHADGQDGNSGGDNQGGDGSGGDGQMSDGFPICGTFALEASSVPPNMLLVVDKSGSMDDLTSAGSNRSKMDDLKDAVNALLTQGDGQIRFGWMAYPNDSECEPGRVSVQIGDDTVGTIQNRLDWLNANGGTPTGTSLEVADDYLVGLADAMHRSFVVLITDGMPTCPNGDGSRPNDQDNQLALDAVTSLRGHGFDTFVIGLGSNLNDTNPDLLNDMAEAGGWPQAGAVKYFQANSLDQLNAVLTQIGGQVIGCNLALNQVPEYPNYLFVFFDGVAVPRDGNWTYNAANNTIEFTGAYCEQLRGGTVGKVDVLMGCRPPD
ncbi:MAG TPA: vWA domain-containing protein [Myxococcota bacterium]|nr:vWA domain-containing protein [Myxococcota bacterium]HRY94761.1 vWA domain-containing protein [Myxococcota bacterium]HSA24049.1 vWA domain-containing protein [Myxococcota bacterium]